MPRAYTRAGAGAALVLCLVLPPGARAGAQTRAPKPGAEAAPARGEEPGVEDLERVARLLRRLSGEHAQSTESVATQIAKLGPEVLPSVLSTLAAERWTQSVGDGKSEVVRLGEPERRALKQAVECFGRVPVLAFARTTCVPECDGAVRVAALTGLSIVGQGKDLELGLELARSAGEESAWGQRTLDALAGSVEGILRRDAAALRRAILLVRSRSCGEAGALIRGCAASGRPEALLELDSLARCNAPWTPLLLPELVRAARRAPHPIDAQVLADVRSQLDSTDIVVVRAAALALAELGDFDAAPALVDMLESESPLLREAARVGLPRLTGLALVGGSGAWNRWLQAECRWFEHEAPKYLRELGAGSLGQRTAALGALAGHRYRRDEIASAVEAALRDEAPEVRGLACSVLAGLGCASSARALLDCLEDPNAAVARSAWAALRRLTGRNLAPQRALWSEALEP